jgi:SAM-dependent methyltransferase
MVAEYTQAPGSSFKTAWRRLMGRVGDMRSLASEEAFQALFSGLTDESLCISVGGGPVRVHPALVNLNIGLFPNVDVTADAYELPYAAGAVDAVHCEAVLEHLEFPDAAVKEMYRVLRPGGRLFAATPFLQAFHGYPDHYQNFTLTGHVRLFERAGFSVLTAGTCVGPNFALRDLATNYLGRAIPGTAGKAAKSLYSLCTIPFLYLDRIANHRSPSADLASSTYVSAVKPR